MGKMKINTINIKCAHESVCVSGYPINDDDDYHHDDHIMDDNDDEVESKRYISIG